MKTNEQPMNNQLKFNAQPIHKIKENIANTLGHQMQNQRK